MGFPAIRVEGPANQQNWNDLSQRLLKGKGDPEGKVNGRIGAIYVREDGEELTVFYGKFTGEGTATGWAPFFEAPEAPIVRGQVGSTGAVVLGSGFTSEKTATGKYTIKLTTELGATGILMLTLVNTAGTYRVSANGKKEFKVETTNAEFAAADAAFNFTIQQS